MLKKMRETFKEESCYKQFFAAMLLMGLAYGLYKGVIDNYLAEIVAMGEFDRGVAEFFRELPGVLMVFILAVLYMFSAEQLYKIGSVILVIGSAMIFGFPADRVLVIIAIFIHSVGDHIQLGMRNTLSMEYSKPGLSGMALGIQNSINHMGTLLGYAVVMIAFLFISGMKAFKGFFLISTLIYLIGTMFTLRMKGNSKQDSTKSRFYFRKKYMKYYMLEIFYGARKQVFLTFGPYVLILFYGANTATISLLFAVSSIACYFCAPVVGRIIDRVGYKVVMVSDTLILVIVCFFYGFAHHIFPRDLAFIVCCINYVLDSVISLASMASNVYVQDISDSAEETRATISTGISVNHLISVIIALFGGWIWKTLGIETLFIASAVLGLFNSAYAATVKGRKQLEGK